MIRIALRVRIRFRSAQDDTEVEGGGRFQQKQSLRHGKPCHHPLHKGGESSTCFKKIKLGLCNHKA